MDPCSRSSGSNSNTGTSLLSLDESDNAFSCGYHRHQHTTDSPHDRQTPLEVVNGDVVVAGTNVSTAPVPSTTMTNNMAEDDRRSCHHRHHRDCHRIDMAVMSTAEDAITAKLATVQAKYYNDPFLECFMSHSQRSNNKQHHVRPRSSTSSSSSSSSSSDPYHSNTRQQYDPQPRRQRHYCERQQQSCEPNHYDQRLPKHIQPIIKRGTHARVCVMDRAIMAAHRSIQYVTSLSVAPPPPSSSSCAATGCVSSPRLTVVCLGAGKDTMFFRYHAGTLLSQQQPEEYVDDNKYIHDSTICLDWYEIDHPMVIEEKIRMIQKSSLLSKQWKVQCKNISTPCHDHHHQQHPSSASPQQNDDLNHNDTNDCCCYDLVKRNTSQVENPKIQCHLIGFDLRYSSDKLIRLLQTHMATSISTTTTSKNNNKKTTTDHNILFTMECVQMYLPEQSSRVLWSALSNAFPNSCLCMYDAILSHDPFGQVMEQHLLEAGMIYYDDDVVIERKNSHRDFMETRPLTGTMTTTTTNNNNAGHDHHHSNSSSLLQTRTLSEQMKKLLNCGWDVRVVGCDMWDAYQTIVTPSQRRWANRCELLDEMEEWMLIMKHYCVIVASNCRHNVNNSQEGIHHPSSSWGHYFCQVGPQSPMGFQQNMCQVMTAETST